MLEGCPPSIPYSSWQFTHRDTSDKQDASSGRKSYLGCCSFREAHGAHPHALEGGEWVLCNMCWESIRCDLGNAVTFPTPFHLWLLSSWAYKTIFELQHTGYSPFLQQIMFPVLQGTLSPTRLGTFAKSATRKHRLDLAEGFNSHGNSWEVVLLGLQTLLQSTALPHTYTGIQAIPLLPKHDSAAGCYRKYYSVISNILIHF